MTASGYAIENAAILGATAPILAELDLEIPDGEVTVLIGPGGAGKSSLLYALSGQRMPGELRLDGSWRYRGLPRTRWTPSDIMFLPQRKSGVAVGTWRDALESESEVVLLDEPAAKSPTERTEVADRVLEQRGKRTIVLATHHIEFTRRIADRVVLLCGGTIDCATTASVFFDDPPTPMAVRMIDQGNCWPPAKLPDHLRWVTPRLAGMARPGLGRDADLGRDLEALAAAGIRLVVSLTEEPLPPEVLAPYGLEGLHFPIPDMGVPRILSTIELCQLIAKHVATERVVVHCHGGLGRTGTILAAQLVFGGRSSHDAIRIVRTAIRHAIQTAGQEEFVHLFAQALSMRLPQGPQEHQP